MYAFDIGLTYVREEICFTGDWSMASKSVVAWWR